MATKTTKATSPIKASLSRVASNKWMKSINKKASLDIQKTRLKNQEYKLKNKPMDLPSRDRLKKEIKQTKANIRALR